ncbi:MAG: phosphatidate cytidylyltransferase [Brachybacterium sp.]|nr:phosphatidate cytidylyltransferase [Brachybacterium sp.]
MSTDTAAAPPQHKRSAGRNLPAAIAVGLALVGALLLCLFVVPVLFPFLVALAMVLGGIELIRALAAGGLRVPPVPLIGGSLAMVFATHIAGVDGLMVAMSLAICAALIWRTVQSRGPIALRDVAASVFCLTWVPFLGCFVLLLFQQEQGAVLVLLALIVPIVNDIGGYIAGVLFGKHPMAPSISPKKSWEGFAGSMIGGVGSALAVTALFLHAPWWVGLVLGAVLVIISTAGDLCESLLKRDLGLKDMGDLLPGHGGVLDRVDSILLAAPTTYILLEVLL